MIELRYQFSGSPLALRDQARGSAVVSIDTGTMTITPGAPPSGSADAVYEIDVYETGVYE